MKREEASYLEHVGGTVDPDIYFDEESNSDRGPDLRQIQIQSLEFSIKLLLSGHVSQVQQMRASVCLAILRRNLNFSEVATYFGVTTQRVGQIAKEIRQFKTLARP